MRFGFVTCVQLGLSCMEEIYAQGGSLSLVLTLPDDKARAKSGRVYLDEFCAERRVPLVKAANVNDPEAVAAVRDHGIDWLFIIGWSQIARKEVLEAPARGALGIHPTLLPQGRGRAAIPWAILQRLERTGVTLFKLDEGVDTGPILAQVELPLSPLETATRLYHRVNDAHRALLGGVWRDLVEDRLELRPQDPAAGSVWPGRSPGDGRITPAMTAVEAEVLVRATTLPYPGAFQDQPDGRVRIWRGRTALADEQLPPGGRELILSSGRYFATVWDLEAPVARADLNISEQS